MIGSSYAWWTSTAEQQGINQITSTCLKVSLNEEKDAIHLEKAYPITDEEAKDLTPFTFKVENTCDTSINYTVNLGISDSSTLKEEYIAVQLNSNTKRILNSLKETTLEKYKKGYELAIGILNGKESKEYKLKLWMDEHVTVEDEDSMNKIFESKVVVNATLNTLAKVYTDDTLNGADPVLKDNLIPVKINEDDGTVTKANIEEEWYNYKNKEWANAVILKEGVETPEDNTEINEENIESYFVWIPKYKYKIFDMGKYDKLEASIQDKGANTPIEIEFGIYDTVDNTIECITPGSGENGSCAVDKWMTPSAFTSFGTNGFWVGKFETGYNGANSTTEAQKNESDSSNVIIKPNVYSWTKITVKNAFDASYNYRRELDSHLMKNTEWGAVAYLTQSIYGRCNNDTKTCEEIRMNNSSSYVTGYAAKEAPITGYDAYKDYGTVNPGNDANANSDFKGAYNYTTKESNMASTTKNYTGIYDMSGGAWEYVMGYMSGNPLNSGFSETNDLTDENSKYFDKYVNKTDTEWNKRILGDATGEMGPFGMKQYNTTNNRINSWYEDWAWIPDLGHSWVRRGGFHSDGVTAGVFAINRHTGAARDDISFRIVLSPTLSK